MVPNPGVLITIPPRDGRKTRFGRSHSHTEDKHLRSEMFGNLLIQVPALNSPTERKSGAWWRRLGKDHVLLHAWSSLWRQSVGDDTDTRW